MDQFEIAGDTDTALRFAPAHDGKLVMLALRAAEHRSVILDPTWLRPLAAWFAGEAQPAALGEDALMPYARRLAVYPDALALVWSTHTEAWLRCAEPYGPARVVIGQRGHMPSSSLSVILLPRARTEAAAYLRRADSEHWTGSAA